ncbi:hemerythrin domain-containing protein [Kaarinaea lacus]
MLGLRKFFNAVTLKSDSFLHVGKKQQPLLYAPGTEIVFDSGLVAKLKRDHAQLVEVYTDIVKYIDQRNYDKLQGLLAVFLGLFNAHALTEYTKLYVFLDYSFRSDNEKHDVIMRFRREMNDIGKSVRQFAHHWRDNGIDDTNLHLFKRQVQQIGEVLTKRIEIEEKQLYEIYDTAPSRFMATNLASH